MNNDPQVYLVCLLEFVGSSWMLGLLADRGTRWTMYAICTKIHSRELCWSFPGHAGIQIRRFPPMRTSHARPFQFQQSYGVHHSTENVLAHTEAVVLLAYHPTAKRRRCETTRALPSARYTFQDWDI